MGSEEGSYLRPIDFLSLNPILESKHKEEETLARGWQALNPKQCIENPKLKH
jgi:hypothetical protein